MLSAAELDPVEVEVVELFGSPVEVEVEDRSAVEPLDSATAVVTAADPIPLAKPVELGPPPQATRPAKADRRAGRGRIGARLARPRAAVICLSMSHDVVRVQIRLD